MRSFRPYYETKKEFIEYLDDLAQDLIDSGKRHMAQDIREAVYWLQRSGSSEASRKEKPKKRKKLSAYNRFVKECAKKPRFRYKSGKKKNMLNMRAIGQAWRKKRK